jgi:hypothetical protein
VVGVRPVLHVIRIAASVLADVTLVSMALAVPSHVVSTVRQVLHVLTWTAPVPGDVSGGGQIHGVSQT